MCSCVRRKVQQHHPNQGFNMHVPFCTSYPAWQLALVQHTERAEQAHIYDASLGFVAIHMRVVVLQALNKHSGHFTKVDEQHIQLFGVHLGNTLAKARFFEEAK